VTPPNEKPNDPPPGPTRLKFWGVRGSIATPGNETVHYGGNTSCVEVRVGSEIIILDAGTGIRRLGLALSEEFKDTSVNLSVFITHTHWDHIQGFPFFLPAYNPKNIVTIYGFKGARQGLESTLSSQMENPYFPISMQQMPGNICIKECQELNFHVNGIPIQAQFVSHPGLCTGYRLFTPGGSIVYIPDVELFHRLRARWLNDTDDFTRSGRQADPEEDRQVIDFIRDAEVVILDAQYSAAEYEQHVGWGHSCVEDTVAFAMHANCKRLYLFHHDPDHNDDDISTMAKRAQEMVANRRSSLIVEAAREGTELTLPAK
jgi:phosphoribosyl 1,2-cyclic phosphodiesterase